MVHEHSSCSDGERSVQRLRRLHSGVHSRLRDEPSSERRVRVSEGDATRQSGEEAPTGSQLAAGDEGLL